MASEELTIQIGFELAEFMQGLVEVVQKLYGALEKANTIMTNITSGYEGKATSELEQYWGYMQQDIYKLIYFYTKCIEFISTTQEVMELVDMLTAESIAQQ